MNLTHRDDREAPEALTPGMPYRVRVQLHATACAFPKGHRIRLSISNAYWPIIWPSPQRVALTLFSGVSELQLPIGMPQASDEELPALPEPACAPVSDPRR